MRIKTFIVHTLSEAVDQIKREMGPEAVILSTRKRTLTLADKWWNRAGPKLEVTAAVDAESPEVQETAAPWEVSGKSSSESGQAGQHQSLRVITRITEERLAPLRDELKKIRASLQEFTAQAHTLPSPSPSPSLSPAKQIDDFPMPHTLPPLPHSPPPQTHLAPEKVFSAGPVLPPGVPGPEDPVYKVCRELLWHRVNEKIVQELGDHLMNKRRVENSLPLESAHDEAASFLMERLPSVEPYGFENDHGHSGLRVIVVVGPTGSGKTTTLVKLASTLMAEKGQRGVFLNLDHFRIGAEEQLRKYAEILQWPCESVVSETEVCSALVRYANYGNILIDTTGYSPYDQNGMTQLQRVLEIVRKKVGEGTGLKHPQLSVSLVIPANLHDPEMSQALDRFRALSFEKIIMTKLDETMCFGSLFNASSSSKRPLAHFTTGQQVPEDIEAATKERVMDCLFNFSGQFPVSLPNEEDPPALWEKIA